MLALFLALLATGCPKKPTEEACVDAWLDAQKLNRFGDPADTVYSGGTPLFDERSGTSQDRLAYVYARQPKVKAACHP
ncbi:MAG: hypothetical protein ACT4TC_26495 [Myxococcaceae bacterium]